MTDIYDDAPSYVDFADLQRTVFDRSRTGERIGAMRGDSPGDENLAIDESSGDDGDGAASDSDSIVTDGRRHSAYDATRISGDWAWKPPKEVDAGRVYTPAEIAASYPDGYINRVEARQEFLDAQV